MQSIDGAIDELAEIWSAAGLASGASILIHSSIKRTIFALRRRKIQITPEHILESFLRALGPDGTLLLPLFNFQFPTSKKFDIRITPSEMGALTESGRLHPEAVRTGHPIYSFAVIGRHSGLFKGVDNISGYGSDSPFAMLRELGGEIGALDLDDQNCMTFYHHVEEMHAVPYRYFKRFSGHYTNGQGVSSEVTYKLFVRDLERSVETHVNPAGELMWKEGLYSGDRPMVNSGLRIISANAMFDYVSSIIINGRAENVLYRLGSSS